MASAAQEGDEAIDAGYGDLQTYLDRGIGLGAAELTELKTRYLEP